MTSEERASLKHLVSVGKTAARKIIHAHVLLRADQGPEGPGRSDTQICKALSIHSNTGVGIHQRLVEQGLEAVLNRKKQDHPSKQPKLDGKDGVVRL